ncbi:MAG: hypothetical protein ACFFCI_07165 [Promethearchaeota archaeon]
MFILDSEVREIARFFPNFHIYIFSFENSKVNISKSPSSRFLPCSSDAQKTAEEMAPILSISGGK